MTKGLQGPTDHMPFLLQQSNLVSFTWWQSVPVSASTNALQVDACFMIASFPILNSVTWLLQILGVEETLPLNERGKWWQFLQSLIFFFFPPSNNHSHSFHIEIISIISQDSKSSSRLGVQNQIIPITSW